MNHIEQKIFDELFENCSDELAQFRHENAETIGLLITSKRFKDLIDICFKQGFAKGMKHNRLMRDKIKSQLQ